MTSATNVHIRHYWIQCLMPTHSSLYSFCQTCSLSQFVTSVSSICGTFLALDSWNQQKLRGSAAGHMCLFVCAHSLFLTGNHSVVCVGPWIRSAPALVIWLSQSEQLLITDPPHHQQLPLRKWWSSPQEKEGIPLLILICHQKRTRGLVAWMQLRGCNESTDAEIFTLNITLTFWTWLIFFYVKNCICASGYNSPSSTKVFPM